MDYLKIYEDLMVDRWYKQPPKKRNRADRTVFYETHHMQPRCKGGKNTADNLIRLTPEDHFFAHLLLAKGYKDDRGLASAVNLMLGMAEVSVHWTLARPLFGLARRAIADGISGENNARWDSAIWSLAHIDGRVFTETRAELVMHTGLRRQDISRLINGATKLTRSGWLLASKRDELGIVIDSDGNPYIGFPHKNRNEKQYELIHTDGRQLRGSLSEMVFATGINRKLLDTVLNGKNRHAGGWRLMSTIADGIGVTGFRNLARADHMVYKFRNFDGRCFQGTRFDFRLAHPEIFQNSIDGMVRGEHGHVKGWCLDDADFAKKRIKSKLTIHTFVHTDLREFAGTRAQFKAYTRLNIKSVFFIMDGACCRGWRLKKWDSAEILGHVLSNSPANDTSGTAGDFTSDVVIGIRDAA